MACKFYNDVYQRCINVNRIQIEDGMVILLPCFPGTDLFKKCEQCKYYVYEE